MASEEMQVRTYACATRSSVYMPSAALLTQLVTVTICTFASLTVDGETHVVRRIRSPSGSRKLVVVVAVVVAVVVVVSNLLNGPLRADLKRSVPLVSRRRHNLPAAVFRPANGLRSAHIDMAASPYSLSTVSQPFSTACQS